MLCQTTRTGKNELLRLLQLGRMFVFQSDFITIIEHFRDNVLELEE